MPTLLLDEDLADSLRRQRQECGGDRWDEVWDGVYVMSPLPNNQHQTIGFKLAAAMDSVIGRDGRGQVFPGVNVTDREDNWEKNFRCPDVAVYLAGNPSVDRDTHWFGGPDLAVEIISRGEDPHAKLGFYAAVGTRELLVVNRRPWRLELFRLHGGTLREVGISTVEDGKTLASAAVPFTWRLVARQDRPFIETVCVETGQKWDA